LPEWRLHIGHKKKCSGVDWAEKFDQKKPG